VANRTLEALPVADHDRLVPTMATVTLESEAVLFEPDQAIDAVHFPLTAVVALVTPMDDGSTVEVATVGNEGIVGVPLVVGGSLAVRAISTVTGTALRMEAATFLEEYHRTDPLRQLVQRYTQALFRQISQAVGCNRLHSNEQRLSRLLLAIRDGVGVDEFSITHELLGLLLGSSRRRATLCVGKLEAAVVIHTRDGRVTILDRDGLEAMACECYRVTQEFDRRAASGRREV
jgi:CRP-like cAMP-binding protein